MPRRRLVHASLLAAAVATFSVTTTGPAEARDGLGFRVGLSRTPDQFVLGGQGEFGPVVGPAYFVPSLDVGPEDGGTVVVFNGDLRWYLLPLPDSGVQFYGEAGPALVLSPGTELGLALTAGAEVPMSRGNRYNLEFRFGFGDVPDFKVMLGVIFATR